MLGGQMKAANREPGIRDRITIREQTGTKSYWIIDAENAKDTLNPLFFNINLAFPISFEYQPHRIQNITS